MNTSMRLLQHLALLVLTLVLVSCNAVQQGQPKPQDRTPDAAESGTGQPTSGSDDGAAQMAGEKKPAEQQAPPLATMDVRTIQAQIMDFSDELMLRLAEAIERIETTEPDMEARMVAHRLKYSVAHGAVLIAGAQNPRVGLLDMYVMIRLQRVLIERKLVPEHFGTGADRLVELFVQSESEMRTIMQTALTPDQLVRLDELIDTWLENNPNRMYAGYVRFKEFAAGRQVTAATEEKGRSGSVLGFLMLDPLAGLDPTTREIEQARLFAERAFFYFQRMPMLVSWQVELLMIDTASEPESQQLLSNLESVANSVEQITSEITAFRAQAPALISQERSEALRQVQTILEEQREEAINQTFEGISVERKAIIEQLATEEERLGDLVTELRQTVESTTALSDSVRSTTAEFGELATLLHLDEQKEKDPNAESTSIKDFTAALQETTRAASELVKLTESMQDATAPDQLEERLEMIEQRLVNAEDSANRIMDRAFRLAVILVIVLVVGLLVVIGLAAWLRSRG